FCEAHGEDMYVAIDHLVGKLDRAVIKHKEKNLAHRHDGAPIKHRVVEE
ncbi:MAG: Sigma 54 modulation protein / ribosomal protein, partial [Pseudomonadota bacterium]